MKPVALFFTASLIFLSICINSTYALNGKESEFSFLKEFNIQTPLNLKISTTGGNINVSARDGNTTKVAFIVRKNGKLMDIPFEKLKDYAVVEIINDNSKIEINVKKTLENNISTGFIIQTPDNTTAALKTSGGDIEINGLSGQQKAGTSGGNIILEKIKGNVNAETSGGDIHLTNIEGKSEVSTSGGNIAASNISKGLIARTDGGNINISKVNEYIDVSTSGGNIDIEEVTGKVKAITSGGDVTANISKLSEKLELKTSGGDINATVPLKLGYDLDLSGIRIITPLSNFKGSSNKTSIEGKINGGGNKIILSTLGGTIKLNYK